MRLIWNIIKRSIFFLMVFLLISCIINGVLLLQRNIEIQEELLQIQGQTFLYLKTTLDRLEEKIENLNETFPTYEYLKSVTVVIYGVSTKCALEEGEEDPKIICSEDKWLGTGVIIKSEENTYILTNAHVAGQELTGKVTLFIQNDFQKVEAEVIKVHQYLDLALLKISGKLKEKQAITKITNAKPQDKVYLVGHHLGREYLYGEGVFAGYEGINDIIQIPCLFGNSGSGVFNQKGELIALVYAVTRFGLFGIDTSHAICIDGLSIKTFVEDFL